MKCSYCQTDFHPDFEWNTIAFARSAKLPDPKTEQRNVSIRYYSCVCSGCGGAHVRFDLHRQDSQLSSITISSFNVYPRWASNITPPIEVPKTISEDFSESVAVLPISAKASAALARRCLQAVLSDHGYTGKNLVNQIDQVLSEKDTTKALPTAIMSNIDVIRNFGNFSAHPITDITSLQIVDVEAGESEWCLQILQDLFDHYYVAPARAAAKRSALATKLAAAGKSPLKK